MILQLGNAMLTMMLAKFMLNDVPHSVGLLQDNQNSLPSPDSLASPGETAHSVGYLADIGSIAKEGLNISTSIEAADRPVFATDTFRIIYAKKPAGILKARSFAQDLPFYSTTEVLPASKIKRIEVDVHNLMKHVPTIKEVGDAYEAALAKYGSDEEIPGKVFDKIIRDAELAQRLEDGEEFLTQENYKEMIRKELKGTAAWNVPVVGIEYAE